MRANYILALMVVIGVSSVASGQQAPAPLEVKVWNADVLAAHHDLIYGGAGKPLGAMEIVGTRNGTFSGKVVVGSTRPMKKLVVSNRRETPR